MALTPQMKAALASPAPTIAGLVEINLPDANIRLIDGSGVVKWGARTFVGRDATFGTLSSISELNDGVGDQAPTLTIELMPSGAAATSALSQPTMQGSPVAVYMACIDRATGLVIPDPELLFLGELDVPTVDISKDGEGGATRTLTYEVVSVFERFFDVNEGARLSPAHHKSIWPGELGLDAITGSDDTIYWGMDAPRPAVVGGRPAGFEATLRRLF